MKKFGLHSKRVLVDDELIEATVVIEDKKIQAILPGQKIAQAFPTESFGDFVIMPGLIDSHVHINEPGRTEWEGFETATMAAAAGGITTLIDMPLNSSPVTIDRESFEKKLAAAKNKCHVHCGFWGGLIPNSHAQLSALLEAGVQGIKIFLTHSGIDDFPNVSEADIIKAVDAVKKHETVLLAHCELDAPLPGAQELVDNPSSYSAYLASRPKEWEDKAIALMISICERYRLRTHIVHLASDQSIAQIRDAKAKGLPLTVETCPHYLFFNAEHISDGSTLHKCAPPIRERSNNVQLWEAITSGLIDFVVTDHSPAPPALKALDTGNFSKAWGGIAGLQMSLSVMWTLASERNLSIPKLAALMSANVAHFLGMADRKGKIAPGYDADLVIWDTETSFTVDPSKLFHRHQASPYQGHELKGKVQRTYVDGALVFSNGQFEQLSKGRLLIKSPILPTKE